MKYLLTFLLISLSFTIHSQIKAFPSAYGGGAYASGGRGGNVYHVTSLDCDSSEGTIRWALAQPRPATIVFDVSGVIDCDTKLWFSGNNLTIAGQTAPLGGITLTTSGANTNPQFSDSQNIILRYLRFRMQFYGDTALSVYPGSSEGDEASNLIFDHISISYAGLQGFTVRGKETHNITFQNGLIAESKTGSLFGDTDPNSAGFSYNNTFRTTLFYNVSHRTPNSSSGRADIYNNVRYDWINRFSTFKTNALVNHFNNYTFTGNKTTLFTQWQSEPQVWQVNGVTNENTSFPPSIYAVGNIVQDLFTDASADNTQTLFIEHAFSSQTVRVPPALFRSTPHTMIGAVPSTYMTAVEASTAVPPEAGANKYLNADGTFGVYRDAPDARYVANTIADTPESWSCCSYSETGENGNRHQAISQQPYKDFLASITGTPINTRPSNFYNASKSLHIPEVWFDANVPSGEDYNDLAPSGYTWLEEYLNGVDGTVTSVNRPIITLIGSATINLVVGATYTDAGATATDVEDGNVTTNIVVSSNVNTAIAGTYEVKYNVEDIDGNNAIEVIRTVVVASESTPNTPSVTGGTTRKAKFIIINN